MQQGFALIQGPKMSLSIVAAVLDGRKWLPPKTGPSEKWLAFSLDRTQLQAIIDKRQVGR